ncbi:uncharacterized protein LOC114321687 [Camellia sinensis]|uniref:LIM zinc-binding domain-containing protein n=1 Tax=Camellia sinensis var. sinensis TaxID=542762 RepID=A0A4S4CW86_CAMSN|nr:uncharacterized protein LOC114321687 [Camellia sinensis]THF93918.1 hypothetical protein TEA_017608 [Camellia sinensis var. sinensis]
MATFAGTTQKCKACEKTVYLVDQLTADNKVYHKACFRCHHCKGTLKLSNYCSFEDPHIRVIPTTKFRAYLLELKTNVLLAREQFTQRGGRRSGADGGVDQFRFSDLRSPSGAIDRSHQGGRRSGADGGVDQFRFSDLRSPSGAIDRSHQGGRRTHNKGGQTYNSPTQPIPGLVLRRRPCHRGASP